MMHPAKKSLLTLTIATALTTPLLAQEKVDEPNTAKFRSEELEHPQIMHTLHMLTDRYGPRMTGTPNHEAAAKWVVAETTRWGMKNAHLEPWDFARPGWLNETAFAYITAPVKENLHFEVLAWTASTKGTVTASTIQIERTPQGPEIPRNNDNAGGFGGGRGGRGGAPQRYGPTQQQMDEWVAANKPKVRGKIVLVGKAALIPVDLETPQPKRRPDDDVKAQYEGDGRGRGGRGGGGGRGEPDPKYLSNNKVEEIVDAMLVSGGALGKLNDAARGSGLIFAQQDHGYEPAKTVPTIIVRNDDYGRIERLLADGDDVKVEMNVVNHIYPEGKTSYNVVAEIPGSDKADEIVMLGGHLDSWHSGTGATDNAAGSSIMLEAARLVQTMGLKPRRTIRVALWSGEEEGLLGSLAYVAQHFGTAENPKPEWFKLDAYFNIDSGTGRPRGAGIFGPPAAADVLRPVLSHFTDWGVFGVSVTNSRATGGTDSTSFNNAGLPGVGFQQDPIEYNTLTHHSSLDTYERIIPDDVERAAAVVAAAVWHVANRDQMIPRFTKEQMPPYVKPN
jgi:carboxypeptidase Q